MNENPFKRKIPKEEIPIILACMKEHDRLRAEAKLLDDAALAEKWEVTQQAMNKLRCDFLGRKKNGEH